MTKILPLLTALIFFGTTYSQTTVYTNHVNNNSNASVTFNVHNANAYDILITDLYCHLGTSSSNDCQLLVNTTPVFDNAVPWSFGVIGDGENGWELKASATIESSSSANGVVNVLSGMEILIPAGATYGFGFSSSSLQYQSLGSGTNTFTQDGVSIITGDGVSWGGASYPSTPVNYPRGFIGGLSFIPVVPCTGTVGPVTSSANCTTGAIKLSVPYAGSSATFQWQSSATGDEFTDILGATSRTLDTAVTSDTYFRCQISCEGNTSTTAAYLLKTPKTVAIDTTICYGSTLSLNGQTYNSPGTYIQTLTAANGCDSTLTIHLSILSEITATLDTAICAGTAIVIGDTSFATAGTFTRVLTSAHGCDSTVTLNLTLLEPTGSTITETACSSFTLNGQTYTNSGTFTQILTNAAGCDSVITLNLTIKHPTNATITERACSSFTLNGQTYTSSGTFTQTVTNASGCDSVITLNLMIDNLETPSVTQNGVTLTASNLSSGVSYQWVDCASENDISGANGQSFVATSNGTYKVVASKGTCSSTSTCYTVTTFAGIAHLFPNPSKGAFSIQFNETYEKVQLELYNSSGNRILRREAANVNMITIDQPLRTGVYHVRIQAGEHVISKRVMIAE